MESSSNIGKWIGAVVLFFIVLILLLGSFGTISAGNIGVETRFGKVVEQVNPGLYIKLPIVDNVTSMNVQTQKESVTAVEAASQDLQNVSTDVTVNYHLNPQDVDTIYSTIGTDYAEKVIDPAIQESVKAVTAKYTAEQLITEREQVHDDIVALLTQKLQQFSLNLDALNITNFNFSDQFNAAVEAKVTAQQNAMTAQNQVIQAEAQASSTIVAAEAQAKSIEIQAEAINSQGGADYVELQAINKWDGKLPTQFVPGSSVPFINVNPATN